MSELGFGGGGEVVQGGWPTWGRRLARRLLVVLAITLLCGAAYLAGIWSGMNTHLTCTVTSPGRIECGDNVSPNPPQAPTTPPPQATGSA